MVSIIHKDLSHQNVNEAYPELFKRNRRLPTCLKTDYGVFSTTFDRPLCQLLVPSHSERNEERPLGVPAVNRVSRGSDDDISILKDDL